MKKLLVQLVLLLIVLVAWVIHSRWDRIEAWIAGISREVSGVVATVSTPVVEGEAPEGEAAPGDTATVYKWQDENGTWHFSNSQPPASARNIRQVTVSTQANVIQSVQSAPGSTPAREAPAPTPAAQQPLPSAPIPFLPNPAHVKKLMQQTEDLQKLMEERQKQLSAAGGG
jgi:hypothetical protein